MPHLDCFPNPFSQDVWAYQQEAEGLDGTSDIAVSSLWARSKAKALTCSQSQESGLLEHMNTAAVVGDMVEIVEKHGEWRSREAAAWLAFRQRNSVSSPKEGSLHYSAKAVEERTRWVKGEEKLQYWGFSYGTLLGATFAALQPHRVHRVIIDGVVDSTDYYHANWLTNLQDTDGIMTKFYAYCHQAGTSNCSLAREKSTPTSIGEAVDALLTGLKEEPLAVPGAGSRSPEIITYSDVMQMIRFVLYKPLAKFPQMADLLSDVIYGNGTAFAEFKQSSHRLSCPIKCSDGDGKGEPCVPEADDGAQSGILCSDAVDISGYTKEEYRDRFMKTLVGQSRWLGEVWATIAMPCIHWKGKAKWKVDAGEFVLSSALAT